MIHNNGDNQNKKKNLGIKDVLYYESYPSCYHIMTNLGKCHQKHDLRLLAVFRHSAI